MAYPKKCIYCFHLKVCSVTHQMDDIVGKVYNTLIDKKKFKEPQDAFDECFERINFANICDNYEELNKHI